MRSLYWAPLFVVLAVLAWGLFGPALHSGQRQFGIPAHPGGWHAFLCVGIAYFVIAVVVPLALLGLKRDTGRWTVRGAFWSLCAGAAGAVGTLGAVLAFHHRGHPLYVMPLVFGLATVVQTVLLMLLGRRLREAGTMWYIGVLLVAGGGGGVLLFHPVQDSIKVVEAADGSITVSFPVTVEGATHRQEWSALNRGELREKSELATANAYYNLFMSQQPPSWGQWVMVFLTIALAALCWGSYGPLLHKGQLKMHGSRWRPFLCVGFVYFLLAVLVPLSMMASATVIEPWNAGGVLSSLAAGAAVAIGALAIIMAFNAGGQPRYVMPAVFGGAPVVNTLATMFAEEIPLSVGVPFFVCLALLIVGAVLVLASAPRAEKDDERLPRVRSLADTTTVSLAQDADANSQPSDAGTARAESSGTEGDEDTTTEQETLHPRGSRE